MKRVQKSTVGKTKQVISKGGLISMGILNFFKPLKILVKRYGTHFLGMGPN